MSALAPRAHLHSGGARDITALARVGNTKREAHSPASAPPEEKSIVSRNRAGEGVNKPSSPRHADSFAPVYRPERSLRLRAGGRQRLATTRRATADRHAARCASRDLCSGGAPRRYTPSVGANDAV